MTSTEMKKLVIVVVWFGLQTTLVLGQLGAAAAVPVDVANPVSGVAALSGSNPNSGANAGLPAATPTTTTTMTPPTTAAPLTVTAATMTSLACENGLAIQLECGTNQVLTVVTAFYGRLDGVTCPGTAGPSTLLNTACSLSNATQTAQGICNGQSRCSLAPTNAQFTDPCSGTYKYLQVNYFCAAPVFSTLQCEGTPKLQLTCPGNTTLFVKSAFWGRDDFNITCPHATAMVSGNCNQPLATSMVQTICNGKNQCYLDPNRAVYSDPCVGSYKYLKVNYTCQTCMNALGDDYMCQYMANLGQCQTNTTWMNTNCLQACTRCEDTELSCTTNQASDSDCMRMAATGACSSNATYMTVYCRKTCVPCNQQTACINNYANSTECAIWRGWGECTNNPYWMLPQCSSACFSCTNNIRCQNVWDSMDDCEYWAANNQCVTNPGFMIPLCTKSCLGCNGVDPPCKNAYTNNPSMCDVWYSQGQCVLNPVWMHIYCWKSCVQCQPTMSLPLPNCTNAVGMDAQCDAIAFSGQCNNAANYKNCFLSCSRCDVNAGINDCYNMGGDTSCAAANSSCSTNPGYMLTHCKKTCTGCDTPPNYIGTAMLPGTVAPITLGMILVLPQKFPTYGQLTGFSAFFVSTQPVYLQVWRNVNTTSYTLIYSQRVAPVASSFVQMFLVNVCVNVKQGDQIGFLSMDGPAPIAHQDNENMIYNQFGTRLATLETQFTQVGLPYTFSLMAAFVPYGAC